MVQISNLVSGTRVPMGESVCFASRPVRVNSPVMERTWSFKGPVNSPHPIKPVAVVISDVAFVD